MSGNVVKLEVHEGRGSQVKACATCQFFHPRTDVYGWKRKWIFLKDGPTSRAVRFATCSAFGGEFASIERQLHCHGDYWSPTPHRKEA